jgi:GPH family glycoside/pentoside/hexuronide:cation symporter
MSDSPSQTGASETKLSIFEKIGYAFGDTASCLYFNTWSQFLLFFYTDVFGITATAAGFMLMVTRIGDVAVDPVIGLIADRTKTRHGKFRPWLRWIAVPMAAIGVAMFYTPNLPPHAKLVYAYATYSAALVLYSAINIPYSALMGVISPNPADRTEISSYRFLGAFSGNLIVQGLLLWLVARLGGGNDRLGYPLGMGVLGLLACVFFMVTFYTTKERVEPPKSQKNDLGRDFSELVRNVPWLAMCMIGVFTLIWVSIRNGAMVYYFKYFVKDTSMTSGFLFSGTIGTLVGVYCTKYFEKFFRGKRLTYIACNLLSALSLVWFYMLKPEDHMMMYVINVISSFIGGPLMPLTWAMFADTADYAEWKFNRRSTGLIFSAGTFSQKMGWSVGGYLAGLLLDSTGFVPNAIQSAETLHGLRLLVGLIPAACCVVTAAAVLCYRIDGKVLKQMGEELKIRRAHDAATAAGEAVGAV